MVDGMGKRASVLLVEDEPMISDLAADALEEQGFAITAVSNASDALRRLMAGAPIDICCSPTSICAAAWTAPRWRGARANCGRTCR